MKNIKIESGCKVFFIMLCLLAFQWGFAQNEKPFWNEIKAFKSADSTAAPHRGQILFIGSSSFTNWKDVNDYFPGYHILNRAFGGSQLVNQIDYIKDMVYPYHPRQIVIYCGENDIASGKTVTADTVLARFKTLYTLIRQKYSRTPIVYVSIKPSPSRWELKETIEGSNKLIAQFIQTQKRIQFVNVYPLMLDKHGQPLADIFLNDRLHMNAKGYAIWQRALLPYLIKPTYKK